MSSRLGVSDAKILALDDYGSSDLFTDGEKIALEYADAITLSEREVDDDLFDRLRNAYDDEAIRISPCLE